MRSPCPSEAPHESHNPIALPYALRPDALYLRRSPLLGGGQPKNAVPLRYVNEELWEAALDLPDSPASTASAGYYFILRNPDGSVLEDFGADRKLDPACLTRDHTVIMDSGTTWARSKTSSSPNRSRMFCSARKMGAPLPARRPTQPTLSMSSRRCLPQGQTICLLGSVPALGSWNQAAPVLLQRIPEDGRFNNAAHLAEVPFPVAYKYGIYDLQKNAFVRYEDGADRSLAEAAPRMDR